MRYKQTVLGVAWAVVQPVVTVIIFTMIFGRLAGLPSENVPYPLFTLAASCRGSCLHAFTGVAKSSASNASVITKVYFPRLIVPLSAVAATLVDFAVAFLYSPA